MDEEKYLKQILNSGKIGILDWGLTDDTILISESLRKMLGYQKVEIDNNILTIAELIPQKDQIEINKLINKLQSEKKTVFSLQHVMIQDDGYHCWVLHNGTISYDKTGEPTRLVSSITNITEIKVSELRIKESEERYRALFENTNEGLLLLDIDHNTILYANETIAQMVDYSIAELIKMKFSEITSIGIDEKLKEVEKLENSVLADITLRRSNNEYIYVDIDYIKTSIDEKDYYICLLRDITERKAYEFALLESKTKYHTYIANAQYGIFIVDSKGNYLEVNEAACAMTGYTEHELLSMNIQDILDPKTLQTSMGDFNNLLKYGKMDVVSNCITKKGKPFFLSINAIRINEDQYMAFTQDITEKLQTEKLLSESEKKFRNLMEQSPVSTQIMDTNGKIIQINSSFTKLWEIPIELMPEVYEKYSILEDKQLIDSGIMPLIEKAFAGDDVILPPMEYDVPDTMETLKFKKIRGRKRWIQSRLYPLKDHNNNVKNVILMAEDISERKQSEYLQQTLFKISESVNISDNLDSLLIHVHEILGTLIDTTNFYIALYDENKDVYSFPYCVDQFESTDFSPQQLKKSLTDYVRRSEKPCLIDEDAHNLLIKSGEVELIGKPSPIWLGVPLKTPSGIIGVVVVQNYDNPNTYTEAELDVMSFASDQIALAIERKRTAEVLRKSEEQFKRIAEQSFDAIIMINLTGVIQYTSPAITTLFGYNTQELLGNNILYYTPSSESDKIKLAFKDTAQGLFINNLTTKFRKKDSTIVEVEVNASPIYEHNEIVGGCGFMKDVTERNSAQRKLIYAEKKYRNLFESAPVSMWREDFSEIKSYIDSLKEKGISNFKEFFDDNPDAVLECVSLLRVVDINKETVKLLKAKNKQEVLSSLEKTFTPESVKAFKNQLLRLIAGDRYFTSNVEFKTFDNKIINTLITIYLDSSYDDWSQALISIVDITEIKKTEKALQESEEKFHALFDNSIATIYLFDSQKNFIASNQAGLDLLGYSRDELLQMKISDVDADPVVVVDAHVELEEGGDLVNFEHQLKRKDGSIITVLNNSKSFFDSTGNIVAIQSTLFDITERKQSEKALQESEKKYRNLFDVAQEGIWVIDENSYTTLVNNSMASMLGYSIDEVIGKQIFDFMDEQGIEISKKNIERRKDGINEQHDFEFITKNGERIFTTLETSPIFDDNKKYIGAIAGVMNITERKLAESTLLDSRKLYDQILDRSEAVIYVKDLNHKYLYINKKFKVLFDISNDDIIGNTDYDIFPKEFADIFIENDTKAATEQRYIRIQERVFHKDGVHIYISDKFPLFDSEGKMYATCGLSTDITELMEAQQKEKLVQQQLVRKDRLINAGHLAAAIAHEINNPMTVLYGSLEEIKDSKEIISDDIIDSMLIVSRRIQKIIKNLLIFTRQIENDKQAIDINIIIQNTFLLTSNLIYKSSIDFVLDLSVEELIIEVDQVRIQQVFINLIFNAMHAIKKGGQIKVKSCKEDNNIIITFEDNGIGMTEEDLKSIFLPFFTTKEVGEGTGLGLSIVHGIIEEHAGTISATSQVGKGSTFTICLPLN